MSACFFLILLFIVILISTALSTEIKSKTMIKIKRGEEALI